MFFLTISAATKCGFFYVIDCCDADRGIPLCEYCINFIP